MMRWNSRWGADARARPAARPAPRVGDPGRRHPARARRRVPRLPAARDRHPADLDLPDPAADAGSATSRSIRCAPDTTYVNFGFWDVVRRTAALRAAGTYNRLVERKVQELGGIKSLYSDSYFPEEEFWRGVWRARPMRGSSSATIRRGGLETCTRSACCARSVDDLPSLGRRVRSRGRRLTRVSARSLLRITMLNDLELTGRARTHVVQVDDLRCALHRDVLEPFLALRAAARRDGIDLKVFSAFRDFSAQLSIWNRKFSGQRPLFTRDGGVLEHAALGVDELLEAILNWSALPGASRHHWGSDIDVFDAAAIAPDYRVQLLPEEFAEGGPFARLNHWLAEHAARFGFFRPYDRERGGVYPGALAHQPCPGRLACARSPDACSSSPTRCSKPRSSAARQSSHASTTSIRRYVVNVGRPEFV